jgi:hypothetical protein
MLSPLNSAVALGSEGIYFGFNDFWLENVEGKFDIELQPTMGTEYGKLIFVLSGEKPILSLMHIIHAHIIH